ncbi:hypothetical protein H1C71_029357, partial [Ictidomys tridecemlineatus]
QKSREEGRRRQAQSQGRLRAWPSTDSASAQAQCPVCPTPDDLARAGLEGRSCPRKGRDKTVGKEGQGRGGEAECYTDRPDTGTERARGKAWGDCHVEAGNPGEDGGRCIQEGWW